MPCLTLPDGLAVGQRHGGVQGGRPVPAEPYGVGDVGEEDGHAVDDGEGVQALHQVAPPLRRDGAGAHQDVQGRVLLIGEPAQPRGGEVEPPCRGKRVGGVEHGGAGPRGLQLLDGLVDRGPGPARHGNHLLPVEEGHPRQGAEQIGFASFGSHSSASSWMSFPVDSPVSSSPASAGAFLGFPVCFPPSGSCSASPSCAAFSRSSMPLR